jgi:hypothetical protein
MTNLKLRAPSPALVISVLALVVALGGTSYAAIVLPANSVGKRQLKKNAVTSAKVKNGSLRAADFRAGQLPAGAPGPAGPQGSPDTPAQVLDKLKLVDGPGSGLNADTLDGFDSADVILIVGSAAPSFDVGLVAADTCAEPSSFGISGLAATDFLLVERETAVTSGIVDSFRIEPGADPQVIYTVCNTTDDSIDPPGAAFRVLAVR